MGAGTILDPGVRMEVKWLVFHTFAMAFQLIGPRSAQESDCFRLWKSINPILGFYRIWIAHRNPSRSPEIDT